MTPENRQALINWHRTELYRLEQEAADALVNELANDSLLAQCKLLKDTVGIVSAVKHFRAGTGSSLLLAKHAVDRL